MMQQLRELQGSAPLLALRLAREGNERFPNSPEAAERTWHVVKSLTDLGKFDEAREEARQMIQAFPNTSWADDVYRHVLHHPPGPPTTVGE
jgi:outer membrane protein assembly factor BamD (BamD/ComL family)